MRPLTVLGCLALAGTLATAALAAPGPGTKVKAATGAVLQILKDPELRREQKWARVSEIISKGFDFESMSRSVLGTSWRKATPQERRDFVGFFTQYLEEIYRTRIESYSDQEIRFDQEKIDGARALVDTTIVSGKTEIPVRYKMRQVEGDWLVYDVVIEGVSMVSNYRNTFNAIAQTGGMQGLLADVQRRIAKHRKTRQTGVATTN